MTACFPLLREPVIRPLCRQHPPRDRLRETASSLESQGTGCAASSGVQLGRCKARHGPDNHRGALHQFGQVSRPLMLFRAREADTRDCAAPQCYRVIKRQRQHLRPPRRDRRTKEVIGKLQFAGERICSSLRSACSAHNWIASWRLSCSQCCCASPSHPAGNLLIVPPWGRYTARRRCIIMAGQVTVTDSACIFTRTTGQGSLCPIFCSWAHEGGMALGPTVSNRQPAGFCRQWV